jgi:hypothetical protein
VVPPLRVEHHRPSAMGFEVSGGDDGSEGRPVVGETYALGDPDYRFGVGPLLARVTRVIRQTVFADEPWWEIEAMAKPPGSVGPGAARDLYVRADALRRPRSGRPGDGSP